MKRSVTAIGLLLLPACGAASNVGTSGQPSSGISPATVPVIPPTNMDILRASCWYLTDAEIIEHLLLVEQSWRVGVTYQEQLDITDRSCAYSVDCQSCWDDIVYFIYFIYH